MLPEFDFQEKKWTGFILLNAPKFGIIGQASNIFLHLHAKPIT
jgi:hypothetical protein